MHGFWRIHHYLNENLDMNFSEIVQLSVQQRIVLVDAIGISILSGAHMTVFPKVYALMKENGLNDVLLTGGGIIPEKDMKKLNEQGVGTLFPPGTDTKVVVDYITEWVKKHRKF